jgi:hypothetical protein
VVSIVEKFRGDSGVLKFFGEDKDTSPAHFFDTLAQFCRAFDVAREHVARQERTKRLEQRRNEANEAKAKRRESQRASSGGAAGPEDDSDLSPQSAIMKAMLKRRQSLA